MAEKQVQKNTLPLGEKVKLINYAKRNPSIGSRKIAEIFKCGRTQVQAILKAKESIIADFETNAPASRKCSRSTKYQDVDDAVYKWYRLARERLVPVSGPMLQSEALLIAKELGNDSFKASNGWLQSFKQRHNIVQLVVSGEAGDVRQDTVEAWMERLPTLVQGYAPEDIWNEDETACFFRALPERTLADAKKQCKGGKKAKQ